MPDAAELRKVDPDRRQSNRAPGHDARMIEHRERVAMHFRAAPDEEGAVDFLAGERRELRRRERERERSELRRG